MQLNVGEPVVVMFVTTRGRTNGIAGPFAGRTVSQMRAEIRKEDRVSPDIPAVLNGSPISKKREKKVCLKPGDELLLGGWTPPHQ